MASNIDVSKPASGSATTESVRDNFAHAKTEIEVLQGQVGNNTFPNGWKSGVDISIAGKAAAAVTGDIVFSARDLSSDGFLRCNGQVISKTTYAALFAVLGQLPLYERRNQRLPSMGTQPASAVRRSKFDPSSTYLAMTLGSSPFIQIQKWNGTDWVKLSDPATLPTSTAVWCDWSPDGQFLAIAQQTSPFLIVYQRSGDVFTKIANPTNLPAAAPYTIKFNHDGSKIALAVGTTPFVQIYSLSGNTLTRETITGMTTDGATRAVDWSSDSSMLAVAITDTPYINVFSVSGNAFTKLTNPTKTITVNGTDIAINKQNGDIILGAALTMSPAIYEVVSGAVRFKEGYGSINAQNMNTISLSADGKFMACGGATSAYGAIFQIDGGQYKRISDQYTGCGGALTSLEISPDGKWLFASSTTSNFASMQVLKPWNESTSFRVPFITTEQTAWIKT